MLTSFGIQLPTEKSENGLEENYPYCLRVSITAQKHTAFIPVSGALLRY